MNFKTNADALPAQRDGSSIKKPTFNASDGRDYAQDAPEIKPARPNGRTTSHSNRSADSDKKAAPEQDFAIPAIKSPAQVAAEKAAD